MKKILFYCQYLAGMGHLVRSTEIIRSLVQDFEVCFINGGQLIPGFEFPANVQLVHLPAILEDDNQLKAVDESQSIEAVKAERTQKLLAVFDQFQPDCIITECFPFSKHKVKFELLPLLQRAKSVDRSIQIVCSLRDLIMTQSLSAQSWAKKYDMVQGWLNQYYDLVLFHADARLQTLDEFFPRVKELNCEVYYTGYVAQSAAERSLAPEEREILNRVQPMITASVGGGRFGFGLLNAVVEASQILKDQMPHHFYAFTGPFMADEEFDQLQHAARYSANLSVRRFTPHLLEYMTVSDLSISLGGYNTTMNILRTGVRSLIFPFAAEEQSGEQSIRALRLQNKNVLNVLYAEELTGEQLARRILLSLQQAPTTHLFDLQGAEKSALRLKALLAERAIAA